MTSETPPLQEFTERATYEVTIHRMSDEALREFVLGLCDGRVYTSLHLPDINLLPNVFMPIGLGLFREHSKEEIEEKLKEIGVFWEWMDKAGPMAINGQPIFFSLRIMHIEDWRRAYDAYEREMTRRKDISI